MTSRSTPDASGIAAGIEAAMERLTTPGTESGRLALDPERVEGDLARLVLAVMEFLRELMELQAVRRFEAGTLTPEEEERLGTALWRARETIRDVAARFGLEEADLALDLGPLGRLV